MRVKSICVARVVFRTLADLFSLQNKFTWAKTISELALLFAITVSFLKLKDT